MGTIAITPLVDGAFVLTTTLNNSFRQLGEINGSLNAANVATIDRLLDYTYIQLGAVSGGLMVGGTANLDYFNNVRYVFDRGRDVNNLTMKNFDNGAVHSRRLLTVQDRRLVSSTARPSFWELVTQRRLLLTDRRLSQAPPRRSTCRTEPMSSSHGR